MGASKIDWYKMYLLQDNNYSENPFHLNQNIRTSMIWGSQWDATINFILKGADKKELFEITGNHTGAVVVAGQFGNDIMNNIFELNSNMLDLTQEAYVQYSRMARGGYYPTTSTGVATSTSGPSLPITSANYGTRMSMYIKINE